MWATNLRVLANDGGLNPHILARTVKRAAAKVPNYERDGE